MIYSGVHSDNKTRRAHDVAICLDPIATKVWKDSGSEWEAVSERIIKIRLKCTPVDITVLSVYSPVNSSAKQMANDADKFYSDLQDNINNVSTNDMHIIMGDLNARMGGNQQQLSSTNSVEPFIADVEYENGARLVDLREINNIIVSNKFFQQKLLHQTSWMHPGNKIWHMIDYTGSITACRDKNLEVKYKNKYKRLRKLAKTKIEHRQEEYWDEVCKDIEKFIKSNDPAAAFSIIRRLKGGSKRVENMPIEDKNGKVLVNSTDQLKRCREYFCELLNVHSTVDPYVINKVQITTTARLELERQNAQPSFEEVKRALNQMKSRKAPGSDEVTADILKADAEPVIK
ncbi:unnamed protein product [Rotaria magnacalcarata]|uniref:Endonuclease/exonuclease/phosphatase domain-containing protein n=3 Tax=Rotaria magnacalcarata TaxID=392030 RepID=A0A816UU27_9BILA|nr:unnamed protein product [Rotaria magnacalcarata]